jgi:L-amino acid N-acyltransferase YncA
MPIRLAAPADANAIAEIWNEGIAERTSTFETRPRMPDEIGREWRISLVAEKGERVLGWGAVSPYSTREAYAGVGEASIYVTAAARGQGIGTALAEALAEQAHAAGMHKLLGKIFPENEASVRLVRRCGFRDVGIHVRHGRLEGKWRDVLLVERLLEAGG